jgi:SAM-dependent methyltransferase
MAEQPDDAWAGDRVARWVRQSATLERQLAPVADELFAAARLAPGERVVDVGCGTGPTTRTAAALVGRDGAVTGLDVAQEMLDAATGVPTLDAAASIDWVCADVVDWVPPPEAFDVVLSRFGVMFFADPHRAFANLAAATAPGGRLAVATWARRDESDLFAVPYRATLEALGRGSELPDDEGPFSLPDAAAVTPLLEGAGWVDVRPELLTLDLPFGGGLAPREAAEAALDFGPTRLLTAGLEAPERERARAAIVEALADHLDGDGHVVLRGRALITTARRS